MRKHKVSNISKCLTLSCWRSPLNRINLNVIQPCIIYASQIICKITHSFFLFSFFDLSTRKNCVLISINEFKANRTELHSNWKSFLLIGHNSFCDLIFFGWLVGFVANVTDSCAQLVFSSSHNKMNSVIPCTLHSNITRTPSGTSLC